jgi:hypothetical protein
VFESFDDGVARFAGESQDPICSRQGNPTPSLSPFNGFLLHQESRRFRYGLTGTSTTPWPSPGG